MPWQNCYQQQGYLVYGSIIHITYFLPDKNILKFNSFIGRKFITILIGWQS
jgi:hypothetical protein